MTPLEEFTASSSRSIWLKYGPLKVYVRKDSARYLDDRLIRGCFDIANIEVSERQRRKGHFKKFLDEVESKFNVIYIENVLNSDLEPFLIRRGYSARNTEFPVSYYKILGIEDVDGYT